MNAVREETSGPLIAEFEGTLPFSLDPFQREAIEKLDRGRGGVLVSAPTSSGKTIVAEYAIFRALREGAKVLYTTPLKALSNQKYHDFVRAYGESLVGLVTGENTIHDDAPVVVMTTEILRNLIYEDPGRLDLVRYVVLDEVHYIDDFPRGSVWEEIVIQAPLTIKLVGLSATIGNYREIADWMAENRGGMETVFHNVRPVELKMWLAINNRFYPLFKTDGGIDQRTWSKAAQEEESSYRIGGYRGLPSNDLLHVIDQLRSLDMLPAIYFIFSRPGCREALQRCAYHGSELTQLMGRAGRRGIDVIGHGAILKEADVEVGTIYEVAMGPTLVVESKFLPSYNMALNLLRVYTPAEAEALMQRSFGQFQKRLAVSDTGERLANVREQLADIRRMWDDPEISIEDVAQYFKTEERRRSIRIELKRLRSEAGAQRRGRGGRRTRAMRGPQRTAERLEGEAEGLRDRQRRPKVARS